MGKLETYVERFLKTRERTQTEGEESPTGKSRTLQAIGRLEGETKFHLSQSAYDGL